MISTLIVLWLGWIAGIATYFILHVYEDEKWALDCIRMAVLLMIAPPLWFAWVGIETLLNGGAQ